ncbi:hypothetical protein Sjap_024820 [Stephania japonica]|uniref:EF-hand domain-containing protein n=1 Tax=Stephania japonica TaxID=461633 RepID=A0AAP0ELB1_9MAGN
MATKEQENSHSVGGAEAESMADLEKVFNSFDANGDGKISSSELENVLRALGSETSKEELKQMMEEIDTDGDGFVDLKEFAEFYRGGSGKGGEGGGGGGGDQELRDAFKMYDKDKNGKISAKELHEVLKCLGEKCTMKDCSRMISSVDKDGDGSVNFEEFKKMMANGTRK